MCLVFIRAKKSDWLVMLVWLRVKAVLLMDSKVINTFFFLIRSQKLHDGDPARFRRTLSPASIYSEQYLKRCIASTSCVYLPLYNDSLIVFLNCKSLWIKVSAK